MFRPFNSDGKHSTHRPAFRRQQGCARQRIGRGSHSRRQSGCVSAPAAGHPSGLRSIPGTPATTIRFINNSRRPMDVNWINFKGKEVGYLKLAPGQAVNQATGVSHSWVVRDVKTQRLMTTAVATAEPTTVRITVPQ